MKNEKQTFNRLAYAAQIFCGLAGVALAKEFGVLPLFALSALGFIGWLICRAISRPTHSVKPPPVPPHLMIAVMAALMALSSVTSYAQNPWLPPTRSEPQVQIPNGSTFIEVVNLVGVPRSRQHSEEGFSGFDCWVYSFGRVIFTNGRVVAVQPIR